MGLFYKPFGGFNSGGKGQKNLGRGRHNGIICGSQGSSGYTRHMQMGLGGESRIYASLNPAEVLLTELS